MGNSGNSLKSCFVCRTNRLNYALDPFHVSRTMQHRETEERKTTKKTKTNEISTHAERHMKHPFFFYCVAFATYEMRQWFSMANTHQIKIILHLHGQVKQIAHSDNGWDEKKSKKNSRRRLENACLHKCNFVAIDELCTVCSQPTARKKSVRIQNHIKQLVVGG